MKTLETFGKLGLSESTIKAIKKKGFEEPTPIQKLVIPLLLENEKDLVGQAQTGTGKTAAFGLPLIEKLSAKSTNVQALILAPTRELAIQVSEEINSLKGKSKLQIIPIYGGQSIELQLRRLKKGAQIVVGTPGRIIDHIKRKTLKLDSISYMILDEADEMLNMGFIEDVEEIMKSTNPEKRVLLFSATMPDKILQLARNYMGDYEFLAVEGDHLTVDLTEQIYFEVAHQDKFEALCRIIDVEHDFYGLVFCRTKIDVDEVAQKLSERGYDAEGLHGDISQYQRERILDKFKTRRIRVLVATDVAARGIDIVELSHVINYALPQDPESYVHRIGRTGRAGKEGTAITFVTPDEYRRLMFIKKIAKTDIRREKLPGASEVIQSKKLKIKEEISEITQAGAYTEYASIAQELLEENDPSVVVASILKHFFQGQLQEKNYYEFKDVSVDRKGKSRLFVALGKSDKMTPRKLVEFVQKKTNVPSRRINDVKIYDTFSFLSVSFEDAETILKYFKKQKKGQKSIVTKAKGIKEKGPKDKYH